MHKLSNNKKPKKFKYITFDIETYIGNINKFRLASVYNGNETIECKNVVSLIQELLKYDGYNIYSHCGSLFDLNFVMENIVNYYDIKKLNIIFSGSLPVQISLTINGKNYTFRDSYGLLKASLSKIAESLLTDKKLLNLKESNIDDMPDDEVQAYCNKDAELLYKAITKFLVLIDETNPRITIASQAMHIFRKRFLKYEWKILSKKEIDFFAKFLHAGRVDVFRKQATNGVAIDVNQLYPYSMKQGAPIYENLIYSNRNIKDYRQIEKLIYDNQKFGFFTIYLHKYTNDFVGYLPFKYPNNTPKLYHLETLDNVYNITTIELKKLINDNIPFTITEFCIMDFKKDFFTDFIDYFDSIKKTNREYKFISKSILNSLSGKFGESYKRQNYSISSDNDYYVNPELGLGYKNSEQISDYINPFILAYIYANSRFFLYNYLNRFIENICYCDTDSIFLNNSINCNYIPLIGDNIGQFKIEKTFKEAIFISQKFYAYIDNDNNFNIKLKGFPKIEKTIKSMDILKNLVLNNFCDFSYNYSRLNRLKSAFKSNNFVDLKTIVKTIKTIELKRKTGNDKITTFQFKLVNNKLQ